MWCYLRSTCFHEPVYYFIGYLLKLHRLKPVFFFCLSFFFTIEERASFSDVVAAEVYSSLEFNVAVRCVDTVLVKLASGTLVDAHSTHARPWFVIPAQMFPQPTGIVGRSRTIDHYSSPSFPRCPILHRS